MYGYICEFISKFTNNAPQLNPGQARYMSITQYSDSSKAVRELDYVVPVAEECIRDAVDWYQEQGFLL
ncbi:MAG: nucleoside-diphosphate-sugar epimerase [Arenicella sp.]|jgi:nucleoside-diphosphate-sugar epimerase